MNHCIEVSRKLFEACCEPALILEATEEALDDISFAIDLLAKVPVARAAFARRNDRLGSQLAHGPANSPAVVSLVGDELLEATGLGEQWLDVSAVMILPARDQETARPAAAVDPRVDLGRASAP